MTATPLSIDEQPLYSDDEQQQQEQEASDHDHVSDLPSLSSISRQQTDCTHNAHASVATTTTTTGVHGHDRHDQDGAAFMPSLSAIERQKTFIVGHENNDNSNDHHNDAATEDEHAYALPNYLGGLVRRQTDVGMNDHNSDDDCDAVPPLKVLSISGLTRQATDKALGDLDVDLDDEHDTDTPHAFASLPNLNEIARQKTDAATDGVNLITPPENNAIPYLPPRVEANANANDNQYLDSNLVMFDADGNFLQNDDGDALFMNPTGDDRDAEALDDDSFNQFIEHAEPVIAVALNPRQPYQCMSGGQDEKCYVWDLVDYDAASLKSEEKQSSASASASATANVVKFERHSDTIVDCAWNCTGKFAAAASMDNSVSIYKSHKHRKMDVEFVCKMEAESEFSFVAWHPNTAQHKAHNHVLMAGCCKHVYVYQYDKTQKTFVQTQLLMAHSAEIECGGFARYNGAYAYSADKDGLVIVWDGLEQVYGGRKKFAFKPLVESTKKLGGGGGANMSLYHESGVTCMDDCLGAPLLLTGSSDRSVCLLNYETGKVLAKLGVHDDSVECVRFNKSYDLTRKYTNFASSSSLDGCIKIWDLYTMKLRHELLHTDGVICHDWFNTSEYSHLLVSGTMNGMVYVWDTRDPSKPIKQYKGHLVGGTGDHGVDAGNTSSVQTVQVSFDDTYIVSGADDSKVLVWKFP